MKRRILICDDDSSILEVSRIILEQQGYEVSIDDGKGIQKKINDFLPDLILLDIRLSGLDGRDISQSLKQQQKTKSIPIIVISASFNIEELTRQAQADDFLKKPFDIMELESIVKRYLES